jgi:hypothetical protein
MQGKVRMLEITIYGLVGLAAMLVIAFYFAYADEFSPAREKPSFALINNPHLSDTQIIGSSPPTSPANIEHKKMGQARVRSARPTEFQV